MAKKSAAEISPVMKTLATYIAQAAKKPLPKNVAERTKHHLLDTLAAMVSGSRLPPGRAAISYIKTLGGTKQSVVIGSKFVTTAEHAALANGMLAHADETDDSHAPSLTHPGCGVVPAALAMAERERANGTQLLRAVALGYDVGSRLSLSLHAHDFREAGHSTHTFGPMFGAAAAAGSLAKLNYDQCRWLLSYTVQQASGVSCWMRDEEHIEKAFDFGGMPARQCRLSLKLKDGRELTIHVKAVLGTAQNPMTRAQVDEKCFHLMAPILGKARARKLCDAVWEIEKLQDARQLRGLLTA